MTGVYPLLLASGGFHKFGTNLAYSEIRCLQEKIYENTIKLSLCMNWFFFMEDHPGRKRASRGTFGQIGGWKRDPSSRCFMLVASQCLFLVIPNPWMWVLVADQGLLEARNLNSRVFPSLRNDAWALWRGIWEFQGHKRQCLTLWGVKTCDKNF